MGAAIRMKGWESPLVPKAIQQPDFIPSCHVPEYESNPSKCNLWTSAPCIQLFDRVLQKIWLDWPIGEQFEETNQIMISLFYMLFYQLLIFGVISAWSLCRRACRVNDLLVHVLVSVYIKITNNFTGEIFEMQGQFTNRKWVRMRTSKKHCHGSSRLLNIDKKTIGMEGMTSLFDTDSSCVVCDNSANCHVCNDRQMFTELRDTPLTNTVVATIGDKTSVPTGIGTVKWTWKDHIGKDHTHYSTDVLFFLTSPVNILSITTLADQLNDDNGTGIDTKRRTSRLHWGNHRYERTFLHSSSNLPEMPVNEGASSFAYFTNAWARKVDDNIQCTCCPTNKHLDKLSDKDKTGFVESFLESVIHENEMMLYKNQGKNAMV